MKCTQSAAAEQKYRQLSSLDDQAENSVLGNESLMLDSTGSAMDSQLLEGDIMEEGQEEWLSEGVLTDDDYNASQQSQQTNPESGSNSQDETMASASADDSQIETQPTDTDQQIVIQQFDSSMTDNQHIILQQDDNDNENDKHFVIDGQHIVFQGLNNQPFIIQQPDGSQQIVLQQFDNQDIDGDQQLILHQLDDQQDGQQLVFQQFEQTDGDQQINNQQEINQQLVFEQFGNQNTDGDQQLDNQQEGSQQLDDQQDGNQQIVLQQVDNQQVLQQIDCQQDENKVDSNIEETLNNFENAQNNSQQTEQPGDELPGELSTFLTRKTKVERAGTHEDRSKDGDDDGNDTDDLLRVLGDGDQKAKNRVTRTHGADSTDDDDSYIFEPKKKNYEAAKNAIRRANASKALPDDDLTDCSSDDESKIVFTRVTRKTSPNRPTSLPQISTNVKPGTLTIAPPKVQKKIVKKVIDVVHIPQTIRNVGKAPITSVNNTSKTSVKLINTSVSTVPKTNLNTSASKTLNSSVSNMPTSSVSKVLYISSHSHQSASKTLNTSVSSVSKTSPTKITFTKVRNMPKTSTGKTINTSSSMPTLSASKILNTSVSTPTTSAKKILNTSVSSMPKSVSNIPKARVSVSTVPKTSVKVLNSSVDSMSKINVSEIVSNVVKRSLVYGNETEQKLPAKQYTNKRLSTQAGSLMNENPTKIVVVKKEGNPTPVKKEQDFSNDNDEVDEKSSDVRKIDQLMMKPEAMDEEMPSDIDSEDEDDAMYDELPSSESEDQSDWFSYDIRAERAGDYIPLLGEKAYQLLLEEKQRVTEKLTTLKKSLKVLTNASREQAEKIQQATQKAAELDSMIKAT